MLPVKPAASPNNTSPKLRWDADPNHSPQWHLSCGETTRRIRALGTTHRVAEASSRAEPRLIARVAADPAICEAAKQPGGWNGIRYWRLHGSPVIYRSSYRDRIDEFADRLMQEVSADGQVWCIFDNTASSAGAADALALTQAIST